MWGEVAGDESSEGTLFWMTLNVTLGIELKNLKFYGTNSKLYISIMLEMCSRQAYQKGFLPSFFLHSPSLLPTPSSFFSLDIRLLLLFSHQAISDLLPPHGLQHARSPYSSPSLGVCPSSCPLNWWCHPTISSFVTPFSSCPQSFPASGSFAMSQLFTSGGQSIGASASASVFPMNILGRCLLGLTGQIFLLSKGLSRFFFSATIQKHQFFGALPSLWSNLHPYMTTGKPLALTVQQSDVSAF